jgi:hypothetical protein
LHNKLQIVITKKIYLRKVLTYLLGSDVVIVLAYPPGEARCMLGGFHNIAQLLVSPQGSRPRAQKVLVRLFANLCQIDENLKIWNNFIVIVEAERGGESAMKKGPCAECGQNGGP